MDTIKLKHELLKSIYSYYDLKENAKYLLYFVQSENSNDFKFQLTNGSIVWCTNLTTHESSKSDLNEFLFNLNACLKKDDYELNKLVDTQEVLNDIIEIELKTKDRLKLKLKPVKSNANELKEFLFNMFDKLTKCEQELNKLSSKCETNPSGIVSNEINNSISSSNKQMHNPQAKRFNLSKQQIANVISPRKPYMSIINPMSKRRKMPKGVQFEDDDDDDDNSSDKSNETDDEETTATNKA